MAKTNSKTLTVEQLEGILMNGGWEIRGGRLGRSLTLIPFFSTEGSTLLVHEGHCPEDDSETELNRRGALAFSLDLERITILSFGDQGAYRIEVRGPALVTQMRKKSEGGGTHEVEQEDVGLIVMVNPDAEADFLRRQSAKREQDNIDAQRRRRDQNKRNAEQYDRQVGAPLRHLTKCASGQQVKEIVSRQNGAVSIVLASGQNIIISMVGGDYETRLHVSGFENMFTIEDRPEILDINRD